MVGGALVVFGRDQQSQLGSTVATPKVDGRRALVVGRSLSRGAQRGGGQPDAASDATFSERVVQTTHDHVADLSHGESRSSVVTSPAGWSVMRAASSSAAVVLTSSSKTRVRALCGRASVSAVVIASRRSGIRATHFDFCRQRHAEHLLDSGEGGLPKPRVQALNRSG